MLSVGFYSNYISIYFNSWLDLPFSDFSLFRYMCACIFLLMFLAIYNKRQNPNARRKGRRISARWNFHKRLAFREGSRCLNVQHVALDSPAPRYLKCPQKGWKTWQKTYGTPRTSWDHGPKACLMEHSAHHAVMVIIPDAEQNQGWWTPPVFLSGISRRWGWALVTPFAVCMGQMLGKGLGGGELLALGAVGCKLLRPIINPATGF